MVINSRDEERRFSLTSEERDKLYKTLEIAEQIGVVEFILHPLSYADTLIRIGYEPFPPIESKSFWTFYNSHLTLPGVVPYARYLFYRDGFIPVYYPFAPVLTKKLACGQLIKIFDAKYPAPEELTDGTPQLYQTFTERNIQHFIRKRCRQLACKMLLTFATHPLHVVTVRCMASFVGRDEIFRTPLSCIVATWKYDGILGFYAGLAPRLLADFIFVSTSSVIYLSMMRSVQNLPLDFDASALEIFDKVSTILSEYMANNYCIQFRNISDIMIVNGSKLALGNPPYTPVYKGWFDCWRDIRSDKLFRALPSLSFNRKYSGPHGMAVSATGENIRIPLDKFGPLYIPPVEETKKPYLLSKYYAAVLADDGKGIRKDLSIPLEVDNNETIETLLNSIVTLHS